MGKAEDILKEMREAGVVPDSTSCNAVLSACCSAGQWDKVTHLDQLSVRWRYVLISFRKSSPPQNHELVVYCYQLSIELTVLWGS